MTVAFLRYLARQTRNVATNDTANIHHNAARQGETQWLSNTLISDRVLVNERRIEEQSH